MHVCSWCGQEVEKVYKVNYNGETIYVCDSCLKQFKSNNQEVEIKTQPKIVKQKVREKTIVENYKEIILNILKEKNLTVEQFAQKINENETHIRKIIHGDYPLDLEIAKKIEKTFHVNLIKEIEYEEEIEISEEDDEELGLSFDEVNIKIKRK